MALTKVNGSLIQTDTIPEVEALEQSVETVASIEGATGFKNRIIGGNFSTNPWQRGTSFNSAASGIYSADRWQNFDTTTTTMNISRATDAPTAAQADIFSQHSLQLEVVVADAALTASQFYMIGQKLEGYNVMDLGFGQAGVRYVTLSFWHKHTKPGTYCVALQNSPENRSYVAEYTQAVTDTWERSEVIIPVDTSGAWQYDANIGIRLYFSVAIGSNFQTTANSWSAGNYLSTSNQVNALDSSSNHFRIALVQLEAGEKATKFEHRSIGQELSLCQRYFFASVQRTNTFIDAYQDGTYYHIQPLPFPVEMRSVPSVTADLSVGNNWTHVNILQITIYAVNSHYAAYRIRANTAGRFYAEKNTQDGAISEFNAEL